MKFVNFISVLLLMPVMLAGQIHYVSVPLVDSNHIFLSHLNHFTFEKKDTGFIIKSILRGKYIVQKGNALLRSENAKVLALGTYAYDQNFKLEKI